MPPARREERWSMSIQVHRNGPVCWGSCPRPNLTDYSMADCCARLRRLAPRAFAVWHELLEVNAHAYEGFPIDSCSVSGHPMAEQFREFLRPYRNGAVLDI